VNALYQADFGAKREWEEIQYMNPCYYLAKEQIRPKVGAKNLERAKSLERSDVHTWHTKNDTINLKFVPKNIALPLPRSLKRVYFL